MANGSVTIATPKAVQVLNVARADSKLAPAIAKAGTNILTNGGGVSFTDATAFARPGLQYGATVAAADQYMMSTSQDVAGPFIFSGRLSMHSKTFLTHGRLWMAGCMVIPKGHERSCVGLVIALGS